LNATPLQSQAPGFVGAWLRISLVLWVPDICEIGSLPSQPSKINQKSKDGQQAPLFYRLREDLDPETVPSVICKISPNLVDSEAVIVIFIC